MSRRLFPRLLSKGRLFGFVVGGLASLLSMSGCSPPTTDPAATEDSEVGSPSHDAQPGDSVADPPEDSTGTGISQADSTITASRREVPAGSAPLPPVGVTRYRTFRSGTVRLDGAGTEFDDELDVSVRVDGQGDARRLDWAVTSSGQNADDGDTGNYELFADKSGVRGSFLTVYGGGVPGTHWISAPLFLPRPAGVGSTWSTEGSGTGRDPNRQQNYEDKLAMESTISAERRTDVGGQTYTGLVIDRSWTWTRRYESSGREDRVTATQTEIFSPQLGLVVCSETTAHTDDHELRYRAVLESATGC